MSNIGDIAVQRSIDMHPKQRPCTLQRRGVGNVPYATSYGWPSRRSTALGTGGTPNQRIRVVLYQQGEQYEPKPDDNIIDADGNEWNILEVNTRLKFDDNPGFASHDCDLILAG